jgi:hypothetical protein
VCDYYLPRELQKLQVVDDFVVVDSNADFPLRQVFRPTRKDVIRRSSL